MGQVMYPRWRPFLVPGQAPYPRESLSQFHLSQLVPQSGSCRQGCGKESVFRGLVRADWKENFFFQAVVPRVSWRFLSFQPKTGKVLPKSWAYLRCQNLGVASPPFHTRWENATHLLILYLHSHARVDQSFSYQHCLSFKNDSAFLLFRSLVLSLSLPLDICVYIYIVIHVCVCMIWIYTRNGPPPAGNLGLFSWSRSIWQVFRRWK